jgi:hypothetical protein
MTFPYAIIIMPDVILLRADACFCNRDVKAMYDISNGTPTRGLAYDPAPLWQSLGKSLYANGVAGT